MILLYGVTFSQTLGNENYLLRIQPGQGNIAISYHGDLAIVYDAGVNSQQMHTKLMCLSQNTPKTIFSPKKKSTLFDETTPCTFQSLGSITPNKSTYTDKVATTQKETTSINSPQKFVDALRDIKIVIYFGSHTDSDHWNLLHYIPAETAVLGIWNGFSEINTHEESSLSEFFGRKNVEIFDPNRLKTSVLGKKMDDFYHDFLLKKIKSEEIKKLIFNNMQDLSNIILWNLNPVSNSENGKSYIISQTYPDANMSIFFTGDAENETFESLPNDYKKQFSSFTNHQIGVVVPHHGSKKHAAFIEKLSPNFYIVSSGNGGQYPHPHIDLIRKIDYLAENKLAKPTQHFWDYYNRTTCTSGCFFFQPEKMIISNPNSAKKQLTKVIKANGNMKIKNEISKRSQFFRENVKGRPAILGTNFSGELFFLKNGDIAQACDFSLSAFGKNFLIDIAKRTDVQMTDLDTTIEENILKLKTDDLYFYKIENNNNALFYKMEEIQPSLNSRSSSVSSQENALSSSETESTPDLSPERELLDQVFLSSPARNLFDDIDTE